MKHLMILNTILPEILLYFKYMDSLSEKLISNTKELKQDILDKKVVTGIDEGYFELQQSFRYYL